MANTVIQASNVFPAGTSVAAYLLAQVSRRIQDAKDPGAAVAADTKTVQTDGSLTFTTLTANEQYAAYAQVNGVNKYLRLHGSP